MTKMKKKPFIYILAALVFVPLGLWLAWPKSNHSDEIQDVPESSTSPRRDHSRAGDHADKREDQFRPSRGGRGDVSMPDARARASRERPLSGSDEEVLKQIDHLIINEALEHSEVAMRLSVFAAEPTLSTEVRAEALGHGILLDVEAFASLASDSTLPEDLAMEVLGEFINHNANPIMQIEVYSEFLKHPLAEIRELATDMLRFMVEDDFEDADTATLLRMGQEKIQALKIEATENSE